MNKRLFIAFGLFFAFMLVFQMVFMPKPQPAKPGQGSATNSNITRRATAPVPDADMKNEPVSGDIVKKAALSEVSTGLLSVGLNRVDGTVSSLRFSKYREGGTNINFIEKSIPYLRNFRVLVPGITQAALQPEVVFDYKKINADNHRFSHTYKNGPAAGLRVTKEYRFYKDKYYFDLSVEVKNTRAKAWKNNYRDREYFSVVWGSPINWRKDKTQSGTYDVQEFVYSKSDGDVEDTSDNKDQLGVVKWAGLKDRYFLLSVIPIEPDGSLRGIPNQASFYQVADGKNKIKTFGLVYPNLERNSLTADARKMTYRIFLGPIKYDLLAADEFVDRKYSFENVLTSFPVVRQISILLEKLIFLIQGAVSNFGIVIILVTLLLKILLYPLTHKSAVSMKKMQLIQPKLTALKEQYKNSGDPRLMNQKMMELYKKEGVNPMGGCLPLLLQLPIFIALYQVLPRLVDMKDVSFLWIRDLSSPDTLFTISAFKNIPLLPYHFNLLPLIMTAVSIFQSKYSQAKSGPQTAQQAQQGKMMMMMPIMFLFLFWSMPSGLVLYWTVQNVLSIIEQHFINKKYDAQLAEAK